VAARLARDGWNLALVARRAEVLKDVAAELADADVDIACYPCDVGEAQAVGDTVAAAVERFGGINGLVNNAGITRDSLLVRMSEDQWHEVIRTNLDGSYHFVRAVAPLMMRARAGRIVNITSVVGQIGNAGQVNYSASKAGLIGLTMAAAKELAGRGVTVNAVAPGFIETSMTEELPEGAVKELKAQIPMRRLGTGEDVAGIVMFLLSQDAAYITGQVINCDGGMVMG